MTPNKTTPIAGDKVNRTVGLALQGLRTRAGLSMAELEAACQLPRGAVGRIERGERAVTAGEIYELTQAVGAVPEDLFGLLPKPPKGGGKGGKKPDKAADASKFDSEEAAQLMRNFSRITDAQVRQRLLQVARTAAAAPAGA